MAFPITLKGNGLAVPLSRKDADRDMCLSFGNHKSTRRYCDQKCQRSDECQGSPKPSFTLSYPGNSMGVPTRNPTLKDLDLCPFSLETVRDINSEIPK